MSVWLEDQEVFFRQLPKFPGESQVIVSLFYNEAYVNIKFFGNSMDSA